MSCIGVLSVGLVCLFLAIGCTSHSLSPPSSARSDPQMKSNTSDGLFADEPEPARKAEEKELRPAIRDLLAKRPVLPKTDQAAKERLLKRFPNLPLFQKAVGILKEELKR